MTATWKPWMLPAASFVIAVLLAVILQPPGSALALRPAQQQTGQQKCRCLLHIRSRAGQMIYGRAAAGGFNSLSLELRGVAFQERKSGITPKPMAEMRAFIKLKVTAQVSCEKNGNTVVSEFNKKFTLQVDDVHEFEMTCRGTNAVCSFSSTLAQLIPAAEAQLKAQLEAKQGIDSCTVQVDQIDLPNAKGANAGSRVVHWELRAKANCGITKLSSTYPGQFKFTGADPNSDNDQDIDERGSPGPADEDDPC